METVRICKKCKDEKDINSFRHFIGSSDGKPYIARICTQCNNKAQVTRTSSTPETKARQKLRQRQTGLRVKYEVFDKYGGKCMCCGESDYRFLTIDHINGGGRKHREGLSKTIGTGGYAFYKWIRSMEYPSNLQLLCYNCNCGKQHNAGVCPHEALPFNIFRKLMTDPLRRPLPRPNICTLCNKGNETGEPVIIKNNGHVHYHMTCKRSRDRELYHINNPSAVYRPRSNEYSAKPDHPVTPVIKGGLVWGTMSKYK